MCATFVRAAAAFHAGKAIQDLTTADVTAFITYADETVQLPDETTDHTLHDVELYAARMQGVWGQAISYGWPSDGARTRPRLNTAAEYDFAREMQTFYGHFAVACHGPADCNVSAVIHSIDTNPLRTKLYL